MQVRWEGNFLQHPHSIMDKRPFVSGTQLIFDHNKKESSRKVSCWFWWGGYGDNFWWIMASIFNGSSWWRAPFLNYSGPCWLFIFCCTFSMLIILHNRLNIHCYCFRIFLHCTFCSNECVTWLTLLGISLKIYYSPFCGRGWCGLPQFHFMRPIWSKNEKMNILQNHRGTRGKRCSDATQCIFAFALHIFGVKIIIFEFRIE